MKFESSSSHGLTRPVRVLLIKYLHCLLSVDFPKENGVTWEEEGVKILIDGIRTKNDLKTE